MTFPHLETSSNSSDSPPESDHIDQDFSEQLHYDRPALDAEEPEEAVAAREEAEVAREILRRRLRRNIQDHEIRRNGPARNQRLFRTPQIVPPFAMRGPIPTAERTAPPRPRGGQEIYTNFSLVDVPTQAIEWPAADASSILTAPVEVVHGATGHLDIVEPEEATKASLELTVEEAADLCNVLDVPVNRTTGRVNVADSEERAADDSSTPVAREVVHGASRRHDTVEPEEATAASLELTPELIAHLHNVLNDVKIQEARLVTIMTNCLPEGPDRDIRSMIVKSIPILSMIDRSIGGGEEGAPPDGNWETVSAIVGSHAFDELGAIENRQLGIVEGGSFVTDRDHLAGNSYQNQVGNKIRTRLISDRKSEYNSLPSNEKTKRPRITREIIRDYLIAGGRFLERIDTTIPIGQHPSGFDWRYVPLEKVKNRVGSIIREKRGKNRGQS